MASRLSRSPGGPEGLLEHRPYFLCLTAADQCEAVIRQGINERVEVTAGARPRHRLAVEPTSADEILAGLGEEPLGPGEGRVDSGVVKAESDGLRLACLRPCTFEVASHGPDPRR